MEKVILLDGAMGTYGKIKGIDYPKIPYMAIENRELLINIHREYLRAGSEIITTNSFRLNPFVIENKEELKGLIEATIDCAKEAIKKEGRGKIAYDIGPLGIKKNSESEIKEGYGLIKSFIESSNDIDYILIETQYLLEESLIALEVFKDINKPLWISYTFDENGNLYSGESIEDLERYINKKDVCGLGINCSKGPKEAKEFIKRIRRFWKSDIIAKPNLGIPTMEEGNPKYNITKEEFRKYMEDLIKEGVTIIGGCCGTTPEYIGELKNLIR
ncbi:homocysteine S-methyltransferase family protein [Clostridium hydrogeniformans]|uniref:homocysteine S-methyltransferase family protein n=1 Tax=Clostridium hydrogeniformans TaxID=349933 RepID=UPI00047F8865|nr:homocysteine S-methyltransferase family protein [Clostridium hydrogeniformans]